RPGRRAGSRRTRGPLHDGRRRLRPRWTNRAPRLVRGGRVCVHRRPRREPPGLELAARVPRLRPARSAGVADGARSSGAPRRTARSAPERGSHVRDPQSALAGRRARPRRRGARAPPPCAAPPDEADRRERARPNGEQGSPLPRRPAERGSRAGRPRRPPTRAGGRPRTMVVTHELDLDRIALAALAEDVGRGDVTTEATVAEDATCSGRLFLKEAGVVCGLPAVEAVFRALDPDVSFEASAADGDRFSEPTELAHISGRTRAVLTGERTALNILGRLSGIVTLTSRFVDAIEGTGAEILDTRKTTPGLRVLEKYAVRCGGGRNHRFGLDDGILVKDNHLRAAGGVRPAVERLRAAGTGLPIEVEAETLDDVREALA